MGAVQTQIGIVTLSTDTIVQVNGITMPNQTTAGTLCSLLPGMFEILPNTFGEQRLTCIRMDGQPLDILANDGISNYTPVCEDFSWLFPLDIRTHPTHRPK